MDDNYTVKGQLELGLERAREKDRNYHLGGRSFYFFDFDDNILFLSTTIVIFHKESGAELHLSSADWALCHQNVGTSGIYRDYEIRYDDESGSFRNFRDRSPKELERLGHQKQPFVEDIIQAIGFPDFHWKGPSWQCFYHATFNQRPVSLITARGHHRDTLKQGIDVLIDNKALPHRPNYLSLYPVSHPEVRVELGDLDHKLSVPELKQRAIRSSVEQAIAIYGPSPHHRFGMSDDDPKNIQLIVEEMTRLKSRYQSMSFFMIETHQGTFTKHEVTTQGLNSKKSASTIPQLSLF
jgi:hypothetical protein